MPAPAWSFQEFRRIQGFGGNQINQGVSGNMVCIYIYMVTPMIYLEACYMEINMKIPYIYIYKVVPQFVS